MNSSIRIHARIPKESQVKSITLGTIEDEDLCPVKTTYQFVTKTAHLRENLPENHTLFLAYIDSNQKPIMSVRPTTVSNWIKAAMGKAGIDIKDYEAHSIKAASSTKAENVIHTRPWYRFFG